MPVTVTSPPTTRESWRVVRKGLPAKALFFEKADPIPKLSPGEVLVKVSAAALNPIVYRLMNWIPNSMAKRIAEADLAGEVVDSNGSEFQIGDQVFGMINPLTALSHGQGTLTTFAVVKATNLVHRPSNITPVEASGLAVTGLTAYQALFHAANLESGQTIFINGGSTSVGAYAIQLAKSRGATVIASGSGKNEEYIRQLGADDFFDYTASPLHEQLIRHAPNPKFHVIFDAVGLAQPDLFLASKKYLAPGGIFASVGIKPSGLGSALSLVWQLMLRPRCGGALGPLKLTNLQQSKSDLEALRKLVAEGKLKPVVDSVYQFEDALKAYERIMTGRARGKVIVQVAFE